MYILAFKPYTHVWADSFAVSSLNRENYLRMTICQEKKIPTKAFERSNVDLFARLWDMGFGPIFADMPGARSIWGFRPTGRQLGQTLQLHKTVGGLEYPLHLSMQS